MNPRDQRKAFLILGAIVLAGVAFLCYQLIWIPLDEYNTEIDRLHKSNQAKEAEIAQILRDKAKLKQWRALSLPGVENQPLPKSGVRSPTARDDAINDAKVLYLPYLVKLMEKHSITFDSRPVPAMGQTKSVAQLAGNIPVYTPLLFPVVKARAKLPNVVSFLKDLQATPLMHRILKVTVKQADGGKSSDLALDLTLEALIVNGSTPRGTNLMAIKMEELKPEVLPAALAPKRDYTLISKKNPFEGAQPPKNVGPSKPPVPLPKPRYTRDLISYNYLTDVTITGANGITHATMWDRSTETSISLGLKPDNKWIPLLKCGEGTTVVWGQVLRIDTRGVTFRVEFKTTAPEANPKLRFKNSKAIYEVPDEELYELAKVGKLKLPSQGRWKVYKMYKSYWEGNLIRDKVVRVSQRTKVDFVVSRWEMMKGRILGQVGDFVLIGLPERYCSFWDEEEDDEDDPGVPAHAGYCFLAVGHNMPDALRSPLPDKEVKEFRTSTLAAP